MLSISEHFEFFNKEHLAVFKSLPEWENYFQNIESKSEIFFDSDHEKNCVKVVLRKTEDTLHEYSCAISTSYFIGLDLLPGLKLPVYVEPKINNEHGQVNYISILLEALKEPESFNHLKGLIDVTFSEPW